jgi:hypothetical protein
MTAGTLEQHNASAVLLAIQIGSFVHSRWFLVYPLFGYNIILGKDFMEEVPQEVNFSTNGLQLPNCIIKGSDYNDRNHSGPLSEILYTVDLATTVYDSDQLVYTDFYFI